MREPTQRVMALALTNRAYYLSGALGPLLVGLAVGQFGMGSMRLPAVLVIGVTLALAATAIRPKPCAWYGPGQRQASAAWSGG